GDRMQATWSVAQPPKTRSPIIRSEDIPADQEWQLATEDAFVDPYDPFGDWWDDQELPEPPEH
ncbi:MAG: hypothetical protein ACM3ZQ_09195, partial [Bacillota bacterium]